MDSVEAASFVVSPEMGFGEDTMCVGVGDVCVVVVPFEVLACFELEPEC